MACARRAAAETCASRALTRFRARANTCFFDIAGLLGAQGNSTALVGTPEQLADALLDYHDLGITTFLIRGFDPLEDAIGYGRDLLPLRRDLIARRRPQAA